MGWLGCPSSSPARGHLATSRREDASVGRGVLILPQVELQDDLLASGCVDHLRIEHERFHALTGWHVHPNRMSAGGQADRGSSAASDSRRRIRLAHSVEVPDEIVHFREAALHVGEMMIVSLGEGAD